MFSWAAGNCQMAHGAIAKGTALAPDLTDSTWLNSDGSYRAIARLVHSGVPRPAPGYGSCDPA